MDVKLASKSEFAALCGVSKARVSQWISEGKIGPDEMQGEGRSAKIKVAQAAEKLKLRIDPGQRVGNGLATNLTAAAPATPENKNDVLDHRLKEARLQSLDSQNRKAQEEEKLRKGVYVLAKEAAVEATHITGTIVQAFESELPGFAAEIASIYHLPQRDVLHLMRKKMHEARGKLSASLRAKSAELPALVEEKIEEKVEPDISRKN